MNQYNAAWPTSAIGCRDPLDQDSGTDSEDAGVDL